MKGQDLWKAFRKDQSKVDEACSRLSVTPPKRFELARRVAGYALEIWTLTAHGLNPVEEAMAEKQGLRGTLALSPSMSFGLSG